MKISPALAILPYLVISLFLSCKKEAGTPKSQGNFIATINNTKWSAHTFKCHYYPKFNELYIFAVDGNSNYRIEMVVILDPISALKKYNFEANGTHIATFFDRCDYTYFSDGNNNSVTGNIEIIEFDTSAKKASARFNFKVYSEGKNDFITVSEGNFEEIEMVVINEGNTLYVPWRGTYLEATINDTTHWYVPYMIGTDHLSSCINIITEREDLRWGENGKTCVSEDYEQKGLRLVIPINKGLGTFPLLPNPFLNLCSENHLGSYSARNSENLYQAVNGSITVTQMDIAQRKFRATFEIELRDASNNTIKITNGKVVVEKLYN